MLLFVVCCHPMMKTELLLTADMTWCSCAGTASRTNDQTSLNWKRSSTAS